LDFDLDFERLLEFFQSAHTGCVATIGARADAGGKATRQQTTRQRVEPAAGDTVNPPPQASPLQLLVTRAHSAEIEPGRLSLSFVLGYHGYDGARK
jgi:hypothetical protein